MVTVASSQRAHGGAFVGAVRASASAAWGRVPPPAMVLVGIISVQFGATLAKRLFAVTGPAGAVALRVVFSAVIMLAVLRPSLRVGKQAWPVIVWYGAVLAGMNICLYQAIDRIPLGVAVTVEFLGPLTVALLGARHWTHLCWALLAAGGVVLLTEGATSDVDWLGVVFALCAAICWGCYIVSGAALGSRTSGNAGLALGMGVAALVALPLGVTQGGAGMFSTTALLAGLGVALLSSVLPYTLEFAALRRIPPRVFGVLMSLEPAVAAVAGLLVLGETLGWRQWLAICCVVVASIGSTRDR